jgi:hypothetical protein
VFATDTAIRISLHATSERRLSPALRVPRVTSGVICLTNSPRDVRSSSDALVVANAGWIIGQYGLILSAVLQNKFAADYFPLAEELLNRAHQLDPNDPGYLGALEQLGTLRDGSAPPQ